ncbi:hypothetical protein [Bosea sp. (in: a-proteobacteria)]|uniref:hypothetical protein n=1 Tax=Bosea sp. (in: a-proteobacteria) TaxID=1871050 RepID=UPI003B3A2FF9
MSILSDDAARFHNRLRILLNIEPHEFDAAGLTLDQWRDFDADPYRFFIRAGDATAARIWSIVEKREARRAA